MEIKHQIVHGSSKVSAGINPTNFLTIHETANRTPGAGAQAHANLQSRGNVRNASWHWSVDDKVAIQSFPHSTRCWHAGKVKGNNESVGIEICVNPDSDLVVAYYNAAKLAAKILAEEGIPLSRMVQHNYWSGKNCPTILRSGSTGLTWDGFVNLVASGDVAPTPPPAPAPPAAALLEDGWWGSATIAAIQRRAGTPVDGEFWYQYGPNRQAAFTSGWVYNYQPGKGSPAVAWLQRAFGTAQDGVFGKNDIAAIQRFYGVPVDRRLDGPSLTVKRLQHALNSGTL